MHLSSPHIHISSPSPLILTTPSLTHTHTHTHTHAHLLPSLQIVVRDYVPQLPEELQLIVGQILSILSKDPEDTNDDTFWVGRLVRCSPFARIVYSMMPWFPRLLA
jgi:hypothetical protein